MTPLRPLDDDVIALMSPGPAGLDPAKAFRLEGSPIWLLQDSDGGFYAYRSFPVVEGWVRLDADKPPTPASEGVAAQPLTGPDGLPMATECLPAMGIDEPPGGKFANVYAIPGQPSTLWAFGVEGDFRLKLDDESRRWVKIASYFSQSPPGPWEPGPEKPDSEVSIRIRRLREARRQGMA